MLASADPNARFKLVCNRVTRAALSAARPSGINTNFRASNADFESSAISPGPHDGDERSKQ